MSGPPLPLEVDLDVIMALPEQEREEELAKVGVLRRVLAGNPLWRYRPHEGELEWKRKHDMPVDGDESRGQREFHELNALAVIYGATVAGNRFGKTHCGVADAVIQTLPCELVPPWLLPYKRIDPADREVRIRVVGPDLPNWLAKVMLSKCRLLIPPQALWKGEFDKAYRDRDRKLTFADGSWWDFLTHDMDVDAFAGVDMDRVYWDEEPPGEHGKQIHEESIGRIIDREGDFRYTLTPLLGLSWLYYELTGADGEPRQDGPDVDEAERTYVVRGDIDHNPHMTEKGKRVALKKWAKDPLKLEARKKGRWLHFEGLVYPEFRPASQTESHVIPDRPIPRAPDGSQAVPVVEVIDPGIHEDHAMAYVAFWVNPDRSVEVFHTHRIWGGTVADMAHHMHETRQALGFKPRRTKIDPAAKNRNPATGKSLQWAFTQAGIRTEAGNNQREAGINEIKTRLRARTITFHASAEDLVDPVNGEFVKHRWKKPRHTRTEDAPKPEVIKRDDDCLDALRYGLMDDLVRPPVDHETEVEEEGTPRAAFRRHLQKVRRRKKGRIGGVF